jgi:hypothetical protein
MRFWLECTRHGSNTKYHVNFSLVGAMWRDGERTILEFVGSGQKAEVNEEPEVLLQMHLGPYQS